MNKDEILPLNYSDLPVVIYVYNIANKQLDFISDHIEVLSGYSAKELLLRKGEELSGLIPDQDIEKYRQAFENFLKKDNTAYFNNVFRIKNKNGTLRRVNSKEKIYKTDDKGRPSHILGSFIDVTDQVDAERYKEAIERLQVLQQKRTQKIRTLSLLQGQEEERKRLSRELHDGIGQLLTAIRIKLNDIEGEQIKDVELRKKIEEVKFIVLKTIKETRNISNALVPIDLYDFGLDSALSHLSETAGQGAGIQINYVSNLNNKRLDSTIEIEVFRITQEALNNSIKYSGAKVVDINISYSEKNRTLKVLIIDNGHGFDYEPDYIYKKNHSRSFGIRNMNERARIVNGNLTIISKKGEGCVISVEVPLKLNTP